MKYIIVINGSPRVGKDTFIGLFSNYAKTKNISSIDKIVESAKILGYNGNKNETNRKFLSELKELSTKFYDSAYNYISNQIKEFKNSSYEVLFIHIREPKEIERIVKDFGAITMIVENNRVDKITSNSSDSNIYEYKKYDYILHNDGTLEDLSKKARGFANYLREIYVS